MRFPRFWTRKGANKDALDRNSIYTLIVSPGEELPIGTWEYFVKRRAGFRCEINSKVHSKGLIAHHIKFTRTGGENILRNGKALCPSHHGEAHKITFEGPLDNRKRIPKLLRRAAGKRKYRALLNEIQIAIDNKEET